MASVNNTDIFSDDIMNATAETRNSKKRPDTKSITEFIQRHHSTNADFNFSYWKTYQNKKIVNKPAIPGLASYFPISNDKLDENKVTESETYSRISTSPPSNISSGISTSPPSNISVHQTSSKCQPSFRCNDFVRNEVFNTFYEDYVEFKHCVNDIV